ncbi:MAG: NAD-dependent epimerase/dehydratase family protein, partial [Promethearchaeota archaeon]
MKTLLTGAFGNVGVSTLEMLLKQGQSVKCFDIKNSKNLKSQKKLLKYSQFETIWGDITNLKDIKIAVQDVSNIIHLAAIIAPLSEKIPEIAYKVNVEGTSLLIKAAKQLKKPPKFILASSVSVFGKKMNEPPPRKVNDPINPTDNYTRHKVEVEKILQKSGLPWLILRLAAISPLNLPTKLDPILFEIPLDQRIEFLYTKDAGMAFANAVSTDINNKILLIGGGKGCQLYQREFIKKLLNAVGISMLPESA